MTSRLCAGRGRLFDRGGAVGGALSGALSGAPLFLELPTRAAILTFSSVVEQSTVPLLLPLVAESLASFRTAPRRS